MRQVSNTRVIRMTESRRFIERVPMGGYGSLNTLPRHTIIMASCLSCGVVKEMDRDVLAKATRRLELIRETATRLRCEACDTKNAKIMTGYYALDANEKSPAAG